jgi:hypothetical protein
MLFNVDYREVQALHQERLLSAQRTRRLREFELFTTPLAVRIGNFLKAIVLRPSGKFGRRWYLQQ